MKKKITREELAIKLIDYVNNKIKLTDLRKWVDDITRKNLIFDDWNGDESFINEVIKRIDLSDIDKFSKIKAKKLASCFILLLILTN